jgi:Ca2+-binding EF-hand superfamily protein
MFILSFPFPAFFLSSFLFKSFDTDGSGEIDFVEFMMAVSVTAKGDVKEKLTLAFKMFDIDKNGSVDRKEMEKIMEAIYDLLGEENRKGENAPSEKVKKIMQKIDINHDGKLTSDEFIQGCMGDEALRNLLAPYASS